MFPSSPRLLESRLLGFKVTKPSKRKECNKEKVVASLRNWTLLSSLEDWSLIHSAIWPYVERRTKLSWYLEVFFSVKRRSIVRRESRVGYIEIRPIGIWQPMYRSEEFRLDWSIWINFKRLSEFLNWFVVYCGWSILANLILSTLIFYFVHSSEFLDPGAKAEIKVDGKTMEATKKPWKLLFISVFMACFVASMVLPSMLISALARGARNSLEGTK